MNIYEEHQKFVLMMQTPEGKKEFERAWHLASNYRWEENEIGGSWLKNGAGAGNKVAGIAIDPETWEFLVGAYGQDHDWAYNRMVDDLCENGAQTPDEAERRIKKGWASKSEEWEFPFVTINGAFFIESDFLKTLEDKILELGIGVPVSSVKIALLRAEDKPPLPRCEICD